MVACTFYMMCKKMCLIQSGHTNQVVLLIRAQILSKSLLIQPIKVYGYIKENTLQISKFPLVLRSKPFQAIGRVEF